MKLADVEFRRGGRKNGLSPDREARLREIMDMEVRNSCKALAVEWNVAVVTVESWRQIVRKRRMSK